MVVQRVSKAAVEVNGESVGAIGRGLMVLVGICREDQEKDADFLARKLLSLRLFDGPDGKVWDRNVKEEGLELLIGT